MYLTEEQLSIAVLKFCELQGTDPNALVPFSQVQSPSNPEQDPTPVMRPFKDTLTPQMKQFSDIIEAVLYAKTQPDPPPVQQ